MPRTKKLQHYPDRYQEIIRECALEGKRIRVPVESRLKALKLAGHWYAFLGSLKAEAAKQPGSDLSHQFRLSASVMVTTEEDASGSVFLIFQNREHSWQAQALRSATVEQTTPQPTAQKTLDSAAQRLMDLQKEIDDGNTK